MGLNEVFLELWVRTRISIIMVIITVMAMDIINIMVLVIMITIINIILSLPLYPAQVPSGNSQLARETSNPLRENNRMT